MFAVYAFMIIIMVSETSCHLHQSGLDGETNSSSATGSSSSSSSSSSSTASSSSKPKTLYIPSPTIYTIPGSNQVAISFNGSGINWNTGTVTFTRGSSTLQVWNGSAGGVVATKGFNVGYGGRGGSANNQILFSGANGTNYNFYDSLVVSGFADNSGNIYQAATFIFGTTTLTNSPIMHYDVDNKMIVIDMPMNMVTSPSLEIDMYYTNSAGNPGPLTKMLPYFPYGQTGTSIWLTNLSDLPDYPYIVLNNLYFVNNNSITYACAQLPQLPAPAITGFSATGTMTLNLENADPNGVITPQNYTFSSPIWTMDYLTNNSKYANYNGFPVINNTNVQNWANWNIYVSANNARKVVFIDSAKAGGPAIATSNITYAGGTVSLPLDVNNNGVPINQSGISGLVWENITAEVYPGIGTNYVITNINSVVNTANQKSAVISYYGAENPVNRGTGNTLDLLFTGVPTLSPAAFIFMSDKIKVWESLKFYGRSACITGNWNSIYNYPSKVIEFVNVAIDPAGRGQASMIMKSTIDMTCNGTLARVSLPFNDPITSSPKNYINNSPVSLSYTMPNPLSTTVHGPSVYSLTVTAPNPDTACPADVYINWFNFPIITPQASGFNEYKYQQPSSYIRASYLYTENSVLYLTMGIYKNYSNFVYLTVTTNDYSAIIDYPNACTGNTN